MDELKKDLKYEIDMYSIVVDVLKNIWLAIFSALICAMFMYIILNHVHKEEYTASVTFAVGSNTSESTYSNLSTATQMADVFTEVFTSDTLKTLIDDDLGEKTDATIEASVITGTNLLVIRAVADKPDTAFKVINSVINNYGQLSDYIFSNAVLEILNSPKVPLMPSNSLNVKSLIVKSSVVTFLAVIAIIIVLSIMRETIKNVKQAEKELETDIFETIRHESKNKTIRAKIKKQNRSLLLTEPVIGFYFKEAFNRIKVKIEYLSATKGYKTFLVTSVEENEGKTTIAADIALSLAQSNYKVLLIDADLRKPAIYKVFEKKPERDKDFVRYLESKCSIKDCLTYDKQHNLYILYSYNSRKNSMELISSEKMKKIIYAYRKVVDYIIIDTPPMSMVSDTEYMADMVDASLLVVRQNYSLIVDINDSIDALNSSKSSLAGCILNNVKSFERVRSSYDKL
ncbi:MAG: polysaccharide biosynthesis tyrosine autokinase [Eubacterium sp.]